MQIFLDFSAIKIKNIAFISAILSGVQDLSWTSIFSKIGFLAVGKYTLIESTEKYLMVTVLTKSLEPIPQQWTHKVQNKFWTPILDVYFDELAH